MASASSDDACFFASTIIIVLGDDFYPACAQSWISFDLSLHQIDMTLLVNASTNLDAPSPSVRISPDEQAISSSI